MASTQIDMTNLQPGTELDMELAKAFGWDAYTYFNGKLVRARKGFDDPSGFDFPASTEWSGMQLVVEKMRRRNWQLVLNDDLDKWTAIYFWDPNGSSYEAESESAPHAVCMAARAALSALEGQEDET